jgi:predicted nucleic acid-binding protein
MILYLDTSSLVKLYVEEDGSSDIDALVKASEFAATSIIAYHLASAFALRQKISASVIFSCSEAKLLAAAVQEGFHSEPR